MGGWKSAAAAAASAEGVVVVVLFFVAGVAGVAEDVVVDWLQSCFGWAPRTAVGWVTLSHAVLLHLVPGQMEMHFQRDVAFDP